MVLPKLTIRCEPIISLPVLILVSQHSVRVLESLESQSKGEVAPIVRERACLGVISCKRAIEVSASSEAISGGSDRENILP